MDESSLARITTHAQAAHAVRQAVTAAARQTAAAAEASRPPGGPQQAARGTNAGQ